MVDERLPRPAWIVMFAIVLGALAGIQWWVTAREGEQLTPAGILVGVALMWLLFAAALASNRPSPAWVIAAAAALTGVVELLVGTVLLSTLGAAAFVLLPSSIAAKFQMSDNTTDLVLFSVLGLALCVAGHSWWRHARHQAHAARAEVQAARAQALVAQRDRELAQSQLMVLRAQVEPHFLWNTLAHVQHLIRKSPPDADRMTGFLIRYLQAALPQIRSDTTTLGIEFESVRAYLELMKIRMGERLAVHVSLPDALAEHAFAPLLVQTLVENAIKHGVEPKVGPVRIDVGVQRDSHDADRLVIEVRDNGVGLQAANQTPGTGLGLRSVRDRLKLLYGDDASLAVLGAPGGGVIARLSFPRLSQ